MIIRHLTDEHKRKIGIANSIILKGRKLSQTTKDKIGKKSLGNKYRAGKILSLEHKKKLRDGAKRYIAEGNFIYKKGKDSPSWRGGKNQFVCNKCGISFDAYAKHRRKKLKFCSMDCKSNYMQGKNHSHWCGGHKSYYLPAFKKQREKIRKRDNYTCQECGYTQEQLGYPLSVHHIDYNKENNVPVNLISLCKSCHAKTGYNKNDWANHFKGEVHC